MNLNRLVAGRVYNLTKNERKELLNIGLGCYHFPDKIRIMSYAGNVFDVKESTIERVK